MKRTLLAALISVVVTVAFFVWILPLLIRDGGSRPGRVAAAIVEMAKIRESLDTFKARENRYPTTEEGLQALVVRPKNGRGRPADWPLLYELQEDSWHHPYIYRCPSADPKCAFDLLSAGPDGKEGTEDDINPDDL